MLNSRMRFAVCLLAALMLLFGVLACGRSEPTAAPTEAPPTEPPPSLPCTTYEMVTLCYDPSIASAVTGETVPAGSEGPWGTDPQHVLLSFGGYPLSGTFHEPHIYVYSVAEASATNPAVAQIVTDLQQLLAQRPAAPDLIPSLPLFNAMQMLRAQVAYLDFQNGSGVRFVTQFDQAYLPISNDEMFTSFQGLTADGAYYIAAVLPTSNPILPADSSTPPGGDWEAFTNNWDSYILDLTAQLDAQAAASFTPNLTLLDDMFRSLQVR